MRFLALRCNFGQTWHYALAIQDDVPVLRGKLRIDGELYVQATHITG